MSEPSSRLLDTYRSINQTASFNRWAGFEVVHMGVGECDLRMAWRADDTFAAVASGRLEVRIGAEFALTDAAEAHRALEGRRTTGKVLLIP